MGKRNQKQKGARGGILQQQARRMAAGLNVLAAVFLAGLLVVLLNVLASRYYARWDLTDRGYFRLSERTVGMLAEMQQAVRVAVFFQKEHPLYDDVITLLREYAFKADEVNPGRLEVIFVDPDRDLARTRDLVQEYELQEPNVVVVEASGRRRYIDVGDVADYDFMIENGRPTRRVSGFRGEEAVSSAIQSVLQSQKPVVYFLKGHGERDVEDFSGTAGYAEIARHIRQDNIDVKLLVLGEHHGVPADCSALIVAGPDRRLADSELDIIARYLENNGRLLLMSDPGTASGLERITSAWGVDLTRYVVVGLSLTGRELLVTSYGQHPVTRRLNNVTTMFYMPRFIEPLLSDNPPADKPRVTVLAANGKNGWAEADPEESPPRFDPDVDRPPPNAVAVAVERGPISGIDVEIKPTRMVVIGDSFFVANGALRGGVGGNADFFLSALNWLIEREALLGLSPKKPYELRLEMGRPQLRRVYLLVVLVVPLGAAAIGFLVWLGRR